MKGPTFPGTKNIHLFFKAEIGRLRLPSFALKAVNIRNSVKNSGVSFLWKAIVWRKKYELVQALSVYD